MPIVSPHYAPCEPHKRSWEWKAAVVHTAIPVTRVQLRLSPLLEAQSMNGCDPVCYQVNHRYGVVLLK